MSDLESSALSVHGETTVTVDVSVTGVVTLVIENYVMTFQLIMESLTMLSALAMFMSSTNSAELIEYEIAGVTGVTVICSRQDSRVIFSIKGDAAIEVERHQMDIHLYGPRLTEFLDCLAVVHEEIMAN
ncbi:MAG: hypothetical protein HC927_02815 [Deltaproteobacteria bacterium]|nr:hypothetical protein [Deltaproteobacteria bacterium]